MFLNILYINVYYNPNKKIHTYDEFNAAGEGYQRMIDASAAMRTASSDEIAEAGAFLLGEHAAFITGADLLIDGGVIASIRTGAYKLH